MLQTYTFHIFTTTKAMYSIFLCSPTFLCNCMKGRATFSLLRVHFSVERIFLGEKNTASSAGTPNFTEHGFTRGMFFFFFRKAIINKVVQFSPFRIQGFNRPSLVRIQYIMQM